jgi:hypothetical protein
MTKAEAQALTVAAMRAQPPAPYESDRAGCLRASDAHHAAMRAWADVAAEASDDAEAEFAQFLADTHEEAWDLWRDEAMQTPQEYPSLYKTARLKKTGDVFKVVAQDAPTHEDAAQFLLVALAGDRIWIGVDQLDLVL